MPSWGCGWRCATLMFVIGCCSLHSVPSLFTLGAPTPTARCSARWTSSTKDSLCLDFSLCYCCCCCCCCSSSSSSSSSLARGIAEVFCFLSRAATEPCLCPAGTPQALRSRAHCSHSLASSSSVFLRASSSKPHDYMKCWVGGFLALQSTHVRQCVGDVTRERGFLGVEASLRRGRAGQMAGWPGGHMTGWPGGRVAGRVAGWLGGRLTGVGAPTFVIQLACYSI